MDIVSKNGNLLLNVGPTADGTIPALQRDRLLSLGRWLNSNGEAIFGTRPWQIAEGTTDSETEIRFTRTDDAVFATLLGTPAGTQICLNDLNLMESGTISLLGQHGALPWHQTDQGIVVSLPDVLPESPAHAFKIVPHPNPSKKAD